MGHKWPYPRPLAEVIDHGAAWVVTVDDTRPVAQTHTVAAELVRAGVLAPDDIGEHPGRHVVTRAIGSERDAPSIATGRNVSGEIGRWLARAGILDPD